MTKEVAVLDDAFEKSLSIWNDAEQLQKVKRMFAPKLDQDEFEIYVQMGIACGLNPFTREIWAVKYDVKAPAQIFIARDGYRKIISRNKAYKGHIVDAVFTNDEFLVNVLEGTVKHVPNHKDRGRLLGAYCMVFMRDSEIPKYVFVELSEYNTGRSVWKDKPATMIKKVAEAQAIRMADQSCSGTYAPDEMPDTKVSSHSSKSDELNKDLNVIEGETVNPETGEVTKADAPKSVEEVEIPSNDAPVFTFDQVKTMMEETTNFEGLQDVAALISSITITKEEKADLTKIYQKKLKEVKKLEA